MSDSDFLELVWENSQLLIRRLPCKITNTKSRFPCSGYFPQSSNAIIDQLEGETSTANRSKEGVADSTFGDPLSAVPELDHHHHEDKKKINSYPNCTLRNSSLRAGYLELLSELYEDDSNAALKPNKNRQLMDSQVVPVNNFEFFKQRCPSKKVVEEIPHCTAENSDSEVPEQPSSKRCEASVPSMRSKEQNTVVDERTGRVNFSIFLRPPALPKSNHIPSSGATRPTSNSPGLSTEAKEDILQGNVRSAPKSNDPFDQVIPFEQTKNINLMASNIKPVLPDSESQKETHPDEQSEAVGYKDTPSKSRLSNKVHGGPMSNLAPNASIKKNPSNGKSAEQMVAASSVCSRGASNNPTYTLKRRYEDTDLSESTSYTMEEPEAEGRTKAAPARGSKCVKRKRKADVHNLSEKRRRDKINKKMRALQELIPNCNKVDKASMLDEAIEYLKILQLQVQMMSMGNGVCMPPNPNPMMLPTMMQHMNVQHLVGTYSPMAVGMGMRMQNGMGCSPAQFPTLPGRPNNMMGFPSQVLLMPMSRSPFASWDAARFCPQSVHAPAAAVQVELPGASAASLSKSKDSNATCH